MAVGVVLEFAGATLDQYDEVVSRMGFTPGGTGEPGGLFHWVTRTDDGIRITDVWQTREHFETFARDKIGPITVAVGVPNPPVLSGRRAGRIPHISDLVHRRAGQVWVAEAACRPRAVIYGRDTQLV
jgi:hypothetical protein